MPKTSIAGTALVAVVAIMTFLAALTTGAVVLARRTERGLIAWVELTQAALDAARASRAGRLVEIEVLENLTQTQVTRQAEVGAGDRYAQRGAVPRSVYMFGNES